MTQMTKMMKRNLFLFTFAAALATGCGDNVTPAADGDPEHPDDPALPVPLTPEGRYAVQSELDLATNVPGRPGVVINYFIDATDDPDDPTKFIVDALIDAMPAGQLKTALRGAAPAVTGYLNDRLLEVAPDLLVRMIDMGDAFGQVAKQFGTLETLVIDAQGRTTKVIHGVHFEIDEVPMDFPLSDFAVADIRLDGLTVSLEPTGKLTISEHALGIPYGTLLRIAVDHAVVPMLDPSAHDVGDVLEKAVNCQRVGQYVYDVLDLGSPSTFESACHAGLAAVAGALYAQLASLDDAALELTLLGTARGIDRDRDGAMDELQAGVWTGSLRYAGTPAPLGAARFFGTRE